MTATLTAFDASTQEIKLRLDAMPPDVTTGDIWIANAERDRCTWTQSEECWWNTGCKQAFEFSYDGHPGPDMPFCPFCGRLVRAESYKAR